MLNMEDQSVHYHYNLLFYFRKRKYSSQACEELLNFYRDDALQEGLCKKLVQENHGDQW